ncbi:mucin-21-like [Heterodontus francisci]|uniref:mucin-21-like n=1 Tax=Heterodontus francisci TaxID=7792 RepID=UPI00355C6514
METVDRWQICLCLFVAVLNSSLGNSTTGPVDAVVTMPSGATSVFNLSTTTMGSNNSTATSGNPIRDTGIGSTAGFTTTPTLKSGTGFDYSSENSTVSVLNDTLGMSNLTKKNGIAINDTGSDLEAGNETEIQVNTPVESPTNTSSLSAKSVNVSVGPAVIERNGHVTNGSIVNTTRVPQQMGTIGKMSSTAKDYRYEITAEPTSVSPTTSAGQKESKKSANDMLTTQSPESETLPMQPTLQIAKTVATTVTSSGPGVTSTITVALSTSRTRVTTTVQTAATSSTTINKAATSFSVQHSEENLANTKTMVNGKSVSNPNQTKMDPLVIGMITVFFIIIGIVSILGFMKYRQRVNQPEFRRLHELPMDDMMEEDTPLSLYSY